MVSSSLSVMRVLRHVFVCVSSEAKFACWPSVQKMLHRTPGLVSVQPSGRWSTLHQAAYAGDDDAVSMVEFSSSAAQTWKR